MVNGSTTTNAGRQGVTLAEVNGVTLSNIHVFTPRMKGIDFESDVPGLGSGNVAISNCSFVNSVNMIETRTGPITFTNCAVGYTVTLSGVNLMQPVSFTGGSQQCRVDHLRACILQKGGSLTFSHVAITRLPSTEPVPDPATEPAWSVTQGGHLTLVHTTVVGPTGTKDATSTVTITP